MKRFALILVIFPFQIFANSNFIVGCWIGKIDVVQQILAIKICFNLDSNQNLIGKIDIPQQNAYQLGLSNIQSYKDSIYFDLIINVVNVAKFAGKIFYPFTDTSKIIGTFRQMSFVGNFDLEKYFYEDSENEEEFKGFQEDVEVFNQDIKLSGTFERPQEAKKCPVVILITGSGPQNRDEEIFGFKVFKDLSQQLLKLGFATLRMDDRGVGGSTTSVGKSSTTFDFASDVEQMINYLKTRADVDTNKIGLLGHSEGAIVSFIVASKRKDVKFIISVAGPMIRGDSIILEQIRLQMQQQNAPDSLIIETLSDQMEIYHIIRKSKDYERAKEILLKQAKKQMEFYPEEMTTQITTRFIERNIQNQLEKMRSDWFTTFIDIDPLEFLREIDCPVLLIFGEKDQQVPPKINISRLSRNIKKKNITIKTIPSANHLFQKCKTGQIFEYAILPKKFAPGFIETISDWLKTVAWKQK